ncbi:MAG: NUDIX hydrolase [Proteobacteria bacterium]|nr:NUDIX hydrolase [Pseudomonadota bacterium]MBI3496138.1 NUDIX hydrolase [Pseudomonadota bacterium]
MTIDEREYPSRPWVGIGVVVLRRSEVLLVQRGKPPRLGQWGLPGGAQHVGETVFEAASREVLEETGVEIEPKAIVTAIDSISRDEAGRVRYHYTLVEVVADWRAGEAAARDDAAAAKWVTVDAIETLGMWSETVRVIGLAQSLRRTLP